MVADTLMNKQRTAQILLVEDNPGDVALTKLAFKEAKLANELTVAMTGEEAVEILKKRGKHVDASTPDLILLDLNLPKMHGDEVLKMVKEDPKLRRIPVVVLSSSQAESDVVKSYDKHANGYVVKPVSLESFNNVMRQLEGFWFTLVVLPDAEVA